MIFNVPGHIQMIKNGLSSSKYHSYTPVVKTQTRRLNRGIYKLGKDYAVQRKRGLRAEPDIRIVMDRIWRETIARPLAMTKNPSFNIISEEGAWAEGGYMPREYELLFRKLNPGWDESGRWAFEFHVVEPRR